MRNIVIVLLGVLFPVSLLAQEKIAPKKQVRFQSINQLGILEGKAASDYRVQTINGVAYKTWFTGIGVGIDDYNYRTIPVFWDLRKKLSKAASTGYVYTHVGPQFAWVKKSQEPTYYYYKNNYTAGWFIEGGIGYSVAMGKKNALLFSAGYSIKTITEKQEGTLYCPLIGPCITGVVNTNNYTLRRLVFLLGLTF
jgi:hypothetical protein